MAGARARARHVAALAMWMPPASRCDELLLLWRCLALQAGLAGPGSALRVCRDRPSFRRYPAVDR